MLPNKFTKVTKSKIYRAVQFYRAIPGLLINKSDIICYEDIEYITILYALEYIKEGGENYFVKVR